MFKDANIEDSTTDTNKNNAGNNSIFPDTMPALLDMDDLVYEIGKLTIQKINVEKGILKLNNKILECQEEKLKLINQLDKVSVDTKDFKNKIEDIEKSNAIYEAKNREIGQYLADERNNVNKLKEQLITEQKKVSKSEITINEYKNENEILNNKINELKESLDNEQSKVFRLEKSLSEKTKKSVKNESIDNDELEKIGDNINGEYIDNKKRSESKSTNTKSS